jgi:hypothetical protein
MYSFQFSSSLTQSRFFSSSAIANSAFSHENVGTESSMFQMSIVENLNFLINRFRICALIVFTFSSSDLSVGL